VLVLLQSVSQAKKNKTKKGLAEILKCVKSKLATRHRDTLLYSHCHRLSALLLFLLEYQSQTLKPSEQNTLSLVTNKNKFLKTTLHI